MTPGDRATYLKALSAQDLQGALFGSEKSCYSHVCLTIAWCTAFREICISHELSEKEVVEQDVPVVNIEMFLFNFPKVSHYQAAVCFDFALPQLLSVCHTSFCRCAACICFHTFTPS